MRELVELFKSGKTFGSLIKLSRPIIAKLPVIEDTVQQTMKAGDLYAVHNASRLMSLLEQAKLLAETYDCVVANPPYMGGGGMNPMLKEYAKSEYPDSKSDLFSMFMERCISLCKKTGTTSMVTMQAWMFMSSFENLRKK